MGFPWSDPSLGGKLATPAKSPRPTDEAPFATRPPGAPSSSRRRQLRPPRGVLGPSGDPLGPTREPATRRPPCQALGPPGKAQLPPRERMPTLDIPPRTRAESRSASSDESTNPAMATRMQPAQNLPPQEPSSGTMKIMVGCLPPGVVQCARTDSWATHTVRPARGARETRPRPRDPLLGLTATQATTPLLAT